MLNTLSARSEQKLPLCWDNLVTQVKCTSKINDEARGGLMGSFAMDAKVVYHLGAEIIVSAPGLLGTQPPCAGKDVKLN